MYCSYCGEMKPVGRMYVSHIDRRAMTSQVILDDKLVTDFKRALFCDGSVHHEAGRIVCEPLTEVPSREVHDHAQGWQGPDLRR